MCGAVAVLQVEVYVTPQRRARTSRPLASPYAYTAEPSDSDSGDGDVDDDDGDDAITRAHARVTRRCLDAFAPLRLDDHNDSAAAAGVGAGGGKIPLLLVFVCATADAGVFCFRRPLPLGMAAS